MSLFYKLYISLNFIGWSIISEPLKVIPGTVQTCSDILKENNLLAISPGGVYEAQFGDRYYRLMWKKRFGFAKVAIDAKVVCVNFYFLCCLKIHFYNVMFYCSQ